MFDLLGERVDGLGDNRAKGRGVVHREIGQHATVDFDAGNASYVGEVLRLVE